MRFRPVEPHDDRGAIADLVDLVTAADGQMPLSEHKYTWVMADGWRRGAVAPGVVAEDDGTMVGFAALVPASAPGEWGLELAVHPRHRRHEVLSDLIERAASEVAEEGGGSVRLWSYVSGLIPDPEIYGFRPERRLHRMRRPLPAGLSPEFPPSVEVRAFRPGRDDATWLEVNNAAFAGHPENGGWTQEDLDERLAMTWFDPAGFRMVWEGDDLAGFCWTKIHPDGRGEIYVIAVAPGHQGRGLGKALVLEGMRHLGAEGVTEMFLFCEASNTQAVALYRRLGFEIERTHRAFLRTV